MDATETATRKTRILLSLVGALALATGCDDKPESSNDAGNVAVTPPGGQDGGTGETADAAPLAPPPPIGLAVVGSDYTSTSISLVGATGTLVKDDCINSGSGASGALSLALSGDVTTPSQPQRGNELWLIDRGNAALDVLDPATCTVRRQLSVGTGFVANPHDLVVVSATKAYVTRFEKNRAATQAANAGGDDLLIIDPQTGGVTGRIAMGAYAAPVDGVAIQARPDRAVIAEGRVFVTLGSADALFTFTGEGRVAVIDPQRDEVTSVVSLTGLKNCGAMDLLPGSKTLLVACSGAFADVDPLLESGIAVVDLAADPPAVTRVLSAELLGSRPVNFLWLVAASPTQVFVNTLGAFTPAVSDALFAIDPTNGHTTPFGAATAFNLGRAAGGGGRLFVPDATSSRPRVHVFSVPSDAAPSETSAFDPEPAHGLPPREIAWY
jgi:hypothetical protein